MNDFIKNKQKQNTFQSKPARKRWSFWVACCIMLFWTIGAILGGISFSQNCVKANADGITSFTYEGNRYSYFDYFGDQSPNSNIWGFGFIPIFSFDSNGANIKFLRDDVYFNSDRNVNYSFSNIFLEDTSKQGIFGGQSCCFARDNYNSYVCLLDENYTSNTLFNSYIYNRNLNTYLFSYGNTYRLGLNISSCERVDIQNILIVDVCFNFYSNDFAYVIISSPVMYGNYYDTLFTYYDSLGNVICYIRFNFSISPSEFGTSVVKDYIRNYAYMSPNATYFLKPSSTDSNYSIGYSEGYNSGYNNGYIQGESYGYSNGYGNGNSTGYTIGYNAGYNAGLSASNSYTFNSLFGAVIDAPIQAFRGLFSFEIFGVDMTNFLLSIFTVCVIITIIKLVI